MTGNWIETRALSERTLAEGSLDFWQKVIVAVQECCDKFNEYYSSEGSAECKPANGHRLVVTITLASIDGPPRKKTVAIDFTKQQPRVTVTVDAGPAQIFTMAANISDVYLTTPSREEISLEDFTRRVLEKPLFYKPQPLRPPSAPTPKSGSSWA